MCFTMDHAWLSISLMEHATLSDLVTVETVKNNTQTMRCETSAHYNVSQRPPLNWR